jgi:hypothetical protein
MVAQRGGARGVAPCRTTQPLTVTAKAASSDSARLRGDGSESVQKAAERKQSLAVKCVLPPWQKPVSSGWVSGETLDGAEGQRMDSTLSHTHHVSLALNTRILSISLPLSHTPSLATH